MAYKVVYEDTHKFHVQHPDGSQFAVAKKGLGPEALKRIQALKVQKMADGGEVQPDPDAQFSAAPQQVDMSQAPAQDASLMSAPMSMGATGSWGDADQSQPEAEAQSNQAMPGPNQVPMDPQTAQLATQQPQPTAPMPSSAQNNDLSSAMRGMPTTKDLDRIVGAQAGAEKASANALSEGYKQQAAVYDQAVKQQQDAMAAFQQRLQKLDSEHERLTQAVANGHVDPNRLYNNLSTGQKIGTAISIILGGMGGGASGNNAGMAVMQNLINKDIDSQKEELGKKQSLLSENLKQYGNLYAAEAATRSQYAAIIQGQLGKVSAQTNNPIAQANAQKAIAGIQLSTMPLRQQLAQHQLQMAMMNQQGGTSDPAKKLNMMIQSGLIPEKESQYAYKELDRVQNLGKQRDAILGAFKKANDENTLGNRALHLGYEPASVGNMQSLMMPYLKDAEGRINEQELERTDKFIPKPGDSPAKIQEKKQGLVKFLNEKSSSAYLDAKGIKPTSGQYDPNGNQKFSEGKVK